MQKVSKLALVGGVAELVAGAGASVVVGNLVKATTPYDAGRLQKVMVSIGGYAIGGVLSDLSAKYVRSQIDAYGEKLRSVFNPPAEEESGELVSDED